MDLQHRFGEARSACCGPHMGTLSAYLVDHTCEVYVVQYARTKSIFETELEYRGS